jgi:hypothetical protein
MASSAAPQFRRIVWARSRWAIAAVVVALLSVSSDVWAQTAPPLGQAARFGTLGNSGVTGASGAGVVVNGDVGSSPTAAITNFPPSSTVPPFIVHYTNDGVVQQAHTDAIAAYNALLVQGPGTVLPDNLATVGALTSGIYSFTTGAPDLPASANLVLNGPGVFVFNVGSSLTANVLSNVTGTANPCNIFWRIGSSATLNGTNFRGTVIANASITVGAGSNLAGRALAGTGASGAVTMAGAGGNTIGGCSPAPPACPAITLSPATLPNGIVGTPYTQTITASGGTPPYTYTVSAGTLPPGLTLNAATGVLSGTPTTAGSSTFTIRASDANGCSVERTYTMVVGAACPTITLSPATLPNGVVGTAYTQAITASGGTPPYTYSVTAGTLPPGLTLNATTGVLSGTPTTAGTNTFTVRGTDANGCFAERSYTMVISAVVPTLPTTLAIMLGLMLVTFGYWRLRQQSKGTPS